LKKTNNLTPNSKPPRQDLKTWLGIFFRQQLVAFVSFIQSVKQLALIATIVTFCLYLFICALAYRSQRALLFYPPRTEQTIPRLIGFRSESLKIELEKGITCYAWLYHHPSSEKLLIYANGNATAMGTAIDRIQWFERNCSASLFFFDYPGYGTSQGRPSQASIEKLSALWNKVLREKGWTEKDTLLFGHSLGGGVMSQWLKHHGGAGLILDSSFTSVLDMAQQQYPILPVSLLLKHPFRSDEVLASAQVPILIAHSPKDEIVPYAMAEDNAKIAKEHLVDFVQLEGSHNDAWLVSQKLFLNSLSKHFPLWFRSK